MISSENKAKLYEILTAHSAMRFRYGVHDCATLALKVLSIQNPISYESWKSRKEAIVIIERQSMLNYIQSITKKPYVSVSDLRVGDVGVSSHHSRFGHVLSVFDGVYFLSAGPLGLARIERAKIICGVIN